MSITLNDNTVKSLKEYLSQFPDNAKLILQTSDYKDHVVQIACNFEWQKDNNTVLLLKGYNIDHMERMIKG